MLGFQTGLRGGVSVALPARRPGGFPFPGEVLTSLRAGQWYLDDAPIPGEVGATYEVKVQDIGRSLRCGRSRPVTVWHPRDIPQVVSMRAAFSGVYHSNAPLIPATDGQTVTEWHDDTTGYAAGQATGVRQPIYQAEGFGSGLPALKFDGVDDFLGIHIGELGFLTGREYALAIIGAQNTSPAFAADAWLFGGHNAANSLAFCIASSAPGSAAACRVDNSSLSITPFVPTTNDVIVGACEVDCISGKLRLLIDGVEASSIGIANASIATVLTSAGIGGSGRGTVPTNCKVSCYITLAGSARPSTRDLNRLYQFAGLCSGRNLGLSMI